MSSESVDGGGGEVEREATGEQSSGVSQDTGMAHPEGGLIDICAEEAAMLRWGDALVLAVVFVPIGALCITLGVSGITSQLATTVLMGLVSAAAAGGVYYFRRQVTLGAAHGVCQLAQRKGLVTAVSKTMNCMRGRAVQSGLKAITIRLARGGYAGAALRVCRHKELIPIEPIAFPFEPQLLNEALSMAVEAQQGSGTPDGRKTDLGRTPGSPIALVRRAIVLSGGRLIVAIFAFVLLTAAWDAVVRWEVTPRLVFWLALTAFTLIAPTGVQEWKRQWFVVPGGIAVRTSGWFRHRWELHLFTRAASVLCVCRQWRGRWGAYVADGSTHAALHATRAECEFLLRAWLSPIPPPPAEQLSDLA